MAICDKCKTIVLRKIVSLEGGCIPMDYLGCADRRNYCDAYVVSSFLLDELKKKGYLNIKVKNDTCNNNIASTKI